MQLLQDIGQEFGEQAGFSPNSVETLSVAEALGSHRLAGVSGIFALYGQDRQLLYLGCSSDMGAELKRLAAGDVSARLQLALWRSKELLGIQVIPVPRQELKRVYVGLRSILKDLDQRLPLNDS